HLLRDKPVGRFSAARLFRPGSLLVIGADTPTGVQVTASIASAGFKGTVAKADTAADIAALPSVPDLAIIAAPGEPELLPVLATKGTFAAVAIGDVPDMADLQRRAGVRVLGPRSFGVAVPGIGLNASLAHLPVPAGRLGLISQSASLCRAVIDWAQ